MVQGQAEERLLGKVADRKKDSELVPGTTILNFLSISVHFTLKYPELIEIN